MSSCPQGEPTCKKRTGSAVLARRRRRRGHARCSRAPARRRLACTCTSACRATCNRRRSTAQPGYVYTPPSYGYSQPAYVYTQPGYVQYNRPHYHGFNGRRDRDRDGVPDRFDRDRDNDGRPNWRDRDRDGDGVPNRFDRRPDNPHGATEAASARTRRVAVRVSEAAHDRHQRDAGQQPGDLGQRLARAQALLQLRDQVGQRHVDEAAAGHHQEVTAGSPPAGRPATSPPGRPAASRRPPATPSPARRGGCRWSGAAPPGRRCGAALRAPAPPARPPRPAAESAMKAEAIRMPSPKQCTLSPVSTAQPPRSAARACAWSVRMGMVAPWPCACRARRPCAWPWWCSCPWCHSSALSSRKKNTSPTSSVANSAWAPAWLSKASGSRCMKAVASSAPAARLSRCCSQAAGARRRGRRPSPARIRAAASQTLPMPAARVARRMAIRVTDEKPPRRAAALWLLSRCRVRRRRAS